MKGELEKRARRIAAGWFVIQSIAVAAWWIFLSVKPSYRTLFQLPDVPASLLAFAPGDLAIVALGSAYVGIRSGRGSSGTVAWIVTGAMLYATLFLITAIPVGSAPPFGALLMAPASIATLWSAFVLSRRVPSQSIPASQPS